MMLPRPATVSQSIIVRVTHRYNTQAEQRDVFESHRHHVFSVAYYMTGDEREAESILQSTFIDAFERETVPTIAALDKAFCRSCICAFLLTRCRPSLPKARVWATEMFAEPIWKRLFGRCQRRSACVSCCAMSKVTTTPASLGF